VIATVSLLRHGGSHLIRPIIAQLGFEIIEPGNFGAPIDEAQGPVIVFLRDPRDRMVATHRWWLGKPRKAASMAAGGESVDAQIAWLLTEGEFLPEMLRWARIWCRWPGALAVRFEELRAFECAEIAPIAAHLGLPPDVDRDTAIFTEVYGRGRTYTGSHSDWRQSFGPLSNAAWVGNGGSELLELMGYQ
jgi:hypothetical protein